MSTESALSAARQRLAKYKEQRQYLADTCAQIYKQFDTPVFNINMKKNACYTAMTDAISTDSIQFGNNMQTVTDHLEYSWDVDGNISSSEANLQQEIRNLDQQISDTEAEICSLEAQLERERAAAAAAAAAKAAAAKTSSATKAVFSGVRVAVSKRK